ncbi:MAG: SDR family NAD(P)-dependent oxidoreductase [Propionibacteriaceae bacterium]|nr:SDR family NAD(P)-dependent oxidoreductase [Propionibacteriaceae bacterium]
MNQNHFTKPVAQPATTRRAVITGASSGIGAATTRTLAAQGWEVLACARSFEKLAQLAAECGANVIPVELDITNPDDVAALAASVDRLDLLVNNAGAAKPSARVLESSPQDWEWMFAVNVTGTLRITQALTPALLASNNALVVVICSMASQDTAAGGGGYAAVKAAESTMTTLLRKEFPLHAPIRITEINPGRVETDFHLHTFEGDAEKAAAIYRNRGAGITPLQPGDIAECIRWLTTLPARMNIDIMNVVPVDQVNPGVGPRRSA